jgi:predicted short-subunit dehydrogenase-like oxidoreductase (DUF2520 family)
VQKQMRPSDGGAFSYTPPLDVAIVGAGRVGGAFARALRRGGHRVTAMLGRTDDLGAVSGPSVVIIAVPDDSLASVAQEVGALIPPGAVVAHTCGATGLAPLHACGERVAAIHPAIAIPDPDTPLAGAVFGVTCPENLRAWCDAFVSSLGGRTLFVPEEERVRYHAALAIASNFAVALAGDAAELLGGHEALIPLLRQTIENVARHGPDAALTGPVVRGDAGTVRAHLDALPPHLLESYVVNARRALARAVASGRLAPDRARAVEEALEGVLVR